jgi:hypothetical protein
LRRIFYELFGSFDSANEFRGAIFPLAWRGKLRLPKRWSKTPRLMRKLQETP